MATGSVPMAAERLGWQQGLATWHQGGWDGNRIWPHGTRVACIDYSAQPHGTRVAGMATGPGHMVPVRLGWQQDLATWHKGG